MARKARRNLFIVLVLAVIVLVTMACGSREATPELLPTEAVALPSPLPSETVESAPAAATESPLPAETPEPAAAVSVPKLPADYEPLPATCESGHVVTAHWATVIRAQPSLKPGPLFSGGGAFEEKEVDKFPCDPGQEFGPFPVDVGGKLVARLTGSPAVPPSRTNSWGAGVKIVFEPALGDGNYGPAQEVVNLWLAAEETEAEMEGEWPGPGRLHAYTTAPRSTGPLTQQCVGQSYTVQADTVEVSNSSPAQPGMTFHNGDRIVTDPSWGNAVLEFNSKFWIGPGSKVEIQNFEPPAEVAGDTAILGTPVPTSQAQMERWLQKHTEAGLPYPMNPNMSEYRELTLQSALKMIEDNGTCDGGLEAKLFLDTQQGQWTAVKLATTAWTLFGKDEYDLLEFTVQELASSLVPAAKLLGAIDDVQDWAEVIHREWENYQAARLFEPALAVWRESRDWDQATLEARVSRLSQERYDIDTQIRQVASDARVSADKAWTTFAAKNPVAAEMVDQERMGKLVDWGQGGKASYLQAYTEAYRRIQYEAQGKIAALMYQQKALRIEEMVLREYRAPLLNKSCEEFLQELAVKQPTIGPCTKAQTLTTLENGLLRYSYKRPNSFTTTSSYKHLSSPSTIVKVADRLIVPDGTEFTAETTETGGRVAVIEGRVTLFEPDGAATQVEAGQQIEWPGNLISDIDLATYDGSLVDGIPLRDLPLDSDIPEPYGVSDLRAENGALPPDWLWQEPNKNLDGPGDATLDVLDGKTLRITVPDDNEFWGSRSDAPRLLHKVSGDFDLEAELLLESKGTNFAFTDFLIFSPNTPLGALKNQMDTGGLGDHYMIVGSAWSRWQNMNKLPAVNRDLAAGAEAPATAVCSKMLRRGEQIKTYWSTDGGKTWTLSGRTVMSLPETLWVGWEFKRMANDGLYDEPAVTTLRDIRLTSAPLGTIPQVGWDVVGYQGTVIPLGTEILMAQDGSKPGYVQAYSPWSIAGDFDLIVRYEASPVEIQPEQERYIHVAVTTNDEKNHAYVRNAMTPDWHRYDSDMEINGGWNRYYHEDTQEGSGRVRLVRKDGVFSSYVWKDGDWTLLADWQEGFTEPVYLDFRYQWKTPTLFLQTVQFTIERLETPDGLLIGPGREEQPAGVEPSDTAPAPTTGPTLTPVPPPATSVPPTQHLHS